ncbi:MAG TPA: sulfur carrier protein ThiS [Chthoniobacterales bacterium]|nr:sulfur carrier protein ThiS [Chthoniobacterales bacterium]
MRILVNGEEADTRGAGNVAELVDRFQMSPQSILIEHNGVALHPREWSQRSLAEGDRIEIVRVVAGG